jgi:hypothetical protein
VTAPGWWQGPDGRWYPPQPPPPPGPRPMAPGPPPPGMGPGPGGPQPAKSGSKGCVIAAVVVAVLVLGVGGIGVYFALRAAHEVGEIAKGGVIGEAECLPVGDVEAVIGSQVRPPQGGTLVGSSGCAYLAVDQTSGIDVNIVTGPGLVAEDELRSFENEGRAAQAEVTSIGVGEGGMAWASDVKSAAATVAGGRLYLVEVMSASGQPIGDRQAQAVTLLERAIAIG